MSGEIIMVLVILIGVIVLLVTEWMPLEVVALLVLGVLAVTGIVSPLEALEGFSNPAVVTIWAVFILSGGLTRTGIANILGRQLLKVAGRTPSLLVVTIMAGFLVLRLTADTTQAQQIKIKYGYEYGKDKFGIYGIADTATAYQDDQMFARAWAKRIIKVDSGPNLLEVVEEHYTSKGLIGYKGILIFRFAFGGAVVVEESPLLGKKRYGIFDSWPSGH